MEWTSEENTETVKRKRRHQVNEGSEKNNNPQPPNWRHIRNSVHQVRPEYYTAIDRCISELHMSKAQAIGASIIFAKELHNLEWKTSDEDENVVDLDTVPANPRLRKEGKAREILALKVIVQRIMDCAITSTITLHDDGSKKQGAGKFSVQGVSIDGEHYYFPTFSLAQETRENQADLKVLIINLLSAASGVSNESLWSKVHFSMTDSTSHNMGVDDIVAEKLGSETCTRASFVPCPSCMHVHQKNARIVQGDRCQNRTRQDILILCSLNV